MKYLKNNKIITLFIILIVSALSIFFTIKDDYLYKNTIMKISNIKTIEKEILTNQLGFKETHYKKIIEGKITNGKDKGSVKKIEYEETSSSVITEKYKKGDKVFIKNDEITDLKRDTYIVILIVIFIISIYLVANYRGLLATLSAILNIIIFYTGLNLYFKGINLFLICFIESLLFTLLSLLISTGYNKKTLAATISVTISIIILLLIASMIGTITNYKGLTFNDLSFLTVPINDVFLAELMIGALGAIMDVSITISSSFQELINKDKNISKEALKNSGIEIGKDIISTMISVLFFTYLCSGLPTFVLALRNGFTLHNYITSCLSLEITRFLIGSIGIVLTIPIAITISILILKGSAKNE